MGLPAQNRGPRAGQVPYTGKLGVDVSQGVSGCLDAGWVGALVARVRSPLTQALLLEDGLDDEVVQLDEIAQRDIEICTTGCSYNITSFSNPVSGAQWAWWRLGGSRQDTPRHSGRRRPLGMQIRDCPPFLANLRH